ncbi:MAG: ATP synthase F1 subunit epsilon [Polyangiaceae bacterium]|nr:ATP synthase F1 subunit epsilon [Polyangiaceae bacterium]
MARKIQLRIITPEGPKLQKEVDEFTAPSVQGEFGVLPEHRPLLAGLKTGILRYTEGSHEESVAVGPGFVKIAEGQAEVLTDHFIAKEDVDAVVARKDLKEADEALNQLSSDATESERAVAIAAARWAATRLELYGDPPPATILLTHEMKLLAHEDYVETLKDIPESDDSAEV